MSEITNSNLETLISADAIRARVKELGAQISHDYAGRNPLLIGVLKGAFMFLSDLMRAIEIPLGIEFIAISSYGAEMRTSGEVRILKDLDVVAALLDKYERREKEVPIDYLGFQIPDKFVVGYGLDFAERYRNLPFIAVLKNLQEAQLGLPVKTASSQG